MYMIYNIDIHYNESVFLFTGERNKIKNTSKNEGPEAGMELFLKVLEKKVSHRDRWFRFVDAIKNAGM